jgi:hypothetical protein
MFLASLTLRLCMTEEPCVILFAVIAELAAEGPGEPHCFVSDSPLPTPDPYLCVLFCLQ